MLRDSASGRAPSRRGVRIQLRDMPSDVNRLAKVLRPVVGSDGQLSFDLFTDVLTVDDPHADPERILSALREAGIVASFVTPRPLARAYWPAIVVAAVFLVAAALIDRMLWNAHDAGAELLEANGQHPLVVRVLCGVAILTSLAIAAPGTWQAVRQRRFNGSLWFTIVTVSAVGFGAWFSASAVALVGVIWDSQRRRDLT